MPNIADRRVILAITLICTVATWLDFFFKWGTAAVTWLTDTTAYLAAFTVGIGVIALTISHGRKVTQKKKGEWPYSTLMLVSFYATIIIGLLVAPMAASAPFQWTYNTLYLPMDISIGSMIAFFFASAVYRTFIMKSRTALLIVIVTTITMLGNVPVGALISQYIPVLGNWFLAVPTTGAFRGVYIGTAVGLIVTTLRTIFGREPGYP